jgi:hypothetical protein
MEEKIVTTVELRNAAIKCGLKEEDAVNDVAEACKLADQSVKSFLDAERTTKWWPAFLKSYSTKCFFRWRMHISNINNSEENKRLWLESFEPLWLEGCKFSIDLSVQQVRSSYLKFLSNNPGKKVTDEDIKQLKEYSNKVADDLEKTLINEITKFTAIQRDLALSFCK